MKTCTPEEFSELMAGKGLTVTESFDSVYNEQVTVLYKGNKAIAERTMSCLYNPGEEPDIECRIY